MALDGGRLVAEFESPLYNVVGFEHEPRTEPQKDAVETAEDRLTDVGAMVSLNTQAECAAQPLAEAIRLFGETEHDDHDHDDGHHDDGQDDDQEASGEHRDLRVTYTFDCASPEKLDRVDVGLLKAFPNMETLDVVYLGPDTQRSDRLTPTNTTLDLGRP